METRRPSRLRTAAGQALSPLNAALRGARVGRASAASLALGIGLAACNAVFGVEAGKPHPTGAGGTGGASGQQCGPTLESPHTGALRWATKSTSSTSSIAKGVAFGGNDDVIVAGVYTGGPMQIGTSMLPHVGEGDYQEDIFLASYGRQDGKPKWAKGFPSDLQQIVYDVAVDRQSGAIVITGSFEGSVSFDEGKMLTSAGATDIFVARFTKDGEPVWSRTIGGSAQQIGLSVAVDGSGAIVLGALINDTIDFAGKTSGSPGDTGLFLGKLDASGKELWSWFYKTGFYNDETSNGERIGLDADADGNIVMTASADGDVFDSPDAFHGDVDVVVIKYDKDGERQWSRMFGGTTAPLEQNGHQWGTAAAFDCTGDVYVTGAFQKDLVFGDLPALTTADPTDEGDIFLVRLRGKDGEPLWAKAFGDSGAQSGLSVGSDAASNVVVGGVIIDDAKSTGIDFGDGQKLKPSQSNGYDYYRDFFLAKFSPSADFAWSHRFGGVYTQEGEITVDPTGLIASAGDFEFDIKFEPTPNGQLADADGQHEMFVTVFEP